MSRKRRPPFPFSRCCVLALPPQAINGNHSRRSVPALPLKQAPSGHVSGCSETQHLLWLPCAPKGQLNSAQGIALGKTNTPISAPCKGN